MVQEPTGGARFDWRDTITVATFVTSWQAHLARACLEAEGIDAFVADEHIGGIQPLYAYAVGGVKVRVPRRDAERAQAILARARRHPRLVVVRDEPAEPGGERCPRCNSPEVDCVSGGLGLRLRAHLPRWLPWPVARARFACVHCGNRFTR